MSNSTFCMHVDCDVADVKDLYKVTIPPATQSWRPIGHGQVRDGMLSAIADAGLTVTRERWALSDMTKTRKGRQVVDPDVINQDGNRCFGLLELGAMDPTDDWSMAIGIQNSLDKTLALRRIIAAWVFVCDNTVFSTSDVNGVVNFRKHTTFIDLQAECKKTIESAQRGFDPFRNFINQLKDSPCTNDQFNEVVCRSIQANIMPNKSASDMLTAWYDNVAPEPTVRADWSGLQDRLESGFYSDRNGWTAHGLWTDIVGKRINPTSPGNVLIDNQRKYNQIASNVLFN